MIQDTSIIAGIREAFGQAADPVQARPMACYMKGIAPFFGIRSPVRRIIQRELIATYKHLDPKEISEVALLLWEQPERELHYFGMEWLYHYRKHFTPQTIDVIGQMVLTKSWWDTVDFLASRCLGIWAEKFPEAAATIIEQYTASDNLWLNRSAILHQLNYGHRTDAGLLSRTILPHASSKAFFLQKATGWALRQYARTNAAWVRNFVHTYPLAPLSKREAMKHLAGVSV